MKLGFIGAGNMSGAILDGVLKGGLLQAEQLWISNHHGDKLERFARLGIHTTTDNCQVVRETDLVILGIKPQMFGQVLPQIAEQAKGKGVLSISPGYSLAWLREQLPGCHVMRAMPNTPLLVGKGCTALVQSGDVPEEIFAAVKAFPEAMMPLREGAPSMWVIWIMSPASSAITTTTGFSFFSRISSITWLQRVLNCSYEIRRIMINASYKANLISLYNYTTLHVGEKV